MFLHSSVNHGLLCLGFICYGNESVGKLCALLDLHLILGLVW